jgi:hypothetical protein
MMRITDARISRLINRHERMIMSKLTPPAPQNMKRRLMFFLEHPDYPGAAAAIQQAKRDIQYGKRVGRSKDRSKLSAIVGMIKTAGSGIRSLLGRRDTNRLYGKGSGRGKPTIQKTVPNA